MPAPPAGGMQLKITITSTSKIVGLSRPGSGELPARLWEGTTEDGIPVHCYVTRICPAIPADVLPKAVAAAFERELQVCAEPTEMVAAIPARMIL